jgi:hypothetical protein
MPTPRPPVGGSEEVRARGSVFREPGPGPGWSLSQGVHHGQRSSHPASRAPGRRRQARIRQRPRRQDRQGRADRDQQHPARQRRQPRGGVHRDPVDAVGQAGRERRRVPGQGLARQHRRPGAQQQLREGRRDRLRHGVHGRGDRLPRQPRRERSPPQRWPRCRGGTQRRAPEHHRPPAAASPAARASRRTPTPEPSSGGRDADRAAPALRTHSTIEGNHHVLDPDPGDPLCPQHPRDAQRPTPERRPDARRGAVHLRRGQAREPLRALHLHPHHRRPARPAQGGFRALHGRPEAPAASKARRSSPST